MEEEYGTIKLELLESKEVRANFYYPAKAKGSVLLLHGSEGGGFGFHDVDAQLPASHGFAALAFTWCGSPAAPVDGVPQAVIDIDLDRTIEALKWLSERPGLEHVKIAISGVSRGAEQALILAALASTNSDIPKPDAVAALAPSDVYVQGFSWNWSSVCGPIDDAPSAKSWRWHGEYIGEVGSPIPIETFDGKVLLMHGEEDEIWSVERSKRIEDRLRKAKRSVETLYMQGEKHRLSNRGLQMYRSKLVDFLEALA